MFGAKARQIKELQQQNAALTERLSWYEGFYESHGGVEVWNLDHQIEEAKQELDRIFEIGEGESRNIETLKSQIQQLRDKRRFIEDNEFEYEALDRLRAEHERLQERLVPMRVKAKIEESGLTEFSHPAEDSIALNVQLKELRKEIASLVRNYTAVDSAEETELPTTKAGRNKLSKDTGKLALRAFNAEVESIIKGATAKNFEASLAKIFKAAEAIERLGTQSRVRINPAFVELRGRELRLAVEHLQAKQLERELERERRAALREEAKAEQELKAERDRLEKEKKHYLNVLKVVQDAGNTEEAAKLQDELIKIEKGINDVEYRQANIRAGYVYVISNIGSFGDQVIKIGMTRRVDPMDRVRELGDASVPFNFDVHALFFSEDAVGVEAELHRRFAEQRVNKINTRREYFYATPTQVKEALIDIAGNLLEFTEEPEAEQYKLSVAATTKAQPQVPSRSSAHSER